MPKCDYCKKEYEVSKGMTFVESSGNVKHFCSAKCRKYSKMKRKKGKWAAK